MANFVLKFPIFVTVATGVGLF